MKKIDTHIRNTVLLSMLVVISLIASLDFVFSLADQLSDTDEHYSTLDAFTFVFLSMPSGLYELLPFTALGGASIGLGILASNNELIVIQSAGVKVWRIVLSVLKPTALIMLISLILGEYIAPPLEQYARSNRAVQRSGNATISPDSGTWRKIGDEYIHINAIAPGGRELFGVTRYRIDENRHIVSSSFAESALYINAESRGESEGYWQLNDISESLLSFEGVSAREYLQEDWRVDLPPELLSVLLVDPQNQSISGLYRFAQFFEEQGLESDTYFLAFWKKLLQPLATLVLVILAISFVFGPLREATMGYRIFVALAIGLVFTIMQRLIEPASLLYGLNPLFAVLTPIMLCAALGMYFIQRVR